MAHFLMMSMGNSRWGSLAGVIMLASGFREQVQWEIDSCCTGVGIGGAGVCARGTLGGGSYGMGETLGGGVGYETSDCVTGVAQSSFGGAFVKWVSCATLGGAYMGA